MILFGTTVSTRYQNRKYAWVTEIECWVWFRFSVLKIGWNIQTSMFGIRTRLYLNNRTTLHKLIRPVESCDPSALKISPYHVNQLSNENNLSNENIWCVFIALAGLSKVISEKLLMTFHDLKLPLGHEECSLFAIFGFRVSSLSATRCWGVFRMVPKEVILWPPIDL